MLERGIRGERRNEDRKQAVADFFCGGVRDRAGGLWDRHPILVLYSF